MEFLINLFLAGLGLHCCMQAASGGGEWGTGSGAEAQPLCLSGPVSRGTGDLPGPGIEPVSPALAREFLITGPPEKPTSGI